MPEINITIGFQIDEPPVFIPWDIEEAELNHLLEKYGLRKVTDGYYCISCKSLGGLSHELGFHFETKTDENRNRKLVDFMKSIGAIVKKIGPARDSINAGKLRELEFFRKAYPDLRKSFNEFQAFFEKTFGQPTLSKKGGESFQHYEWKFKGIKIYHYVLDRFGPEEHMKIIKA